MSDGAKVHYIHLLEQLQAVQMDDIVYDAGGVHGETGRLLKRHGAIIKGETPSSPRTNDWLGLRRQSVNWHPLKGPSSERECDNDCSEDKEVS